MLANSILVLVSLVVGIAVGIAVKANVTSSLGIGDVLQAVVTLAIPFVYYALVEKQRIISEKKEGHEQHVKAFAAREIELIQASMNAIMKRVAQLNTRKISFSSDLVALKQDCFVDYSDSSVRLTVLFVLARTLPGIQDCQGRPRTGVLVKKIEDLEQAVRAIAFNDPESHQDWMIKVFNPIAKHVHVATLELKAWTFDANIDLKIEVAGSQYEKEMQNY